MPTPSVPDGYGRASHQFSCDDAEHVCFITYNFVDNPAHSADTIATNCRNDWIASFPLSSLADNWNNDGVSVYVNRGGTLSHGLVATSSNGTRAVDPPPIAAATILRKRTSFVGRAFRGRIFLPAGYQNEADIDDAGTIDATRVGQLNTSWNGFINLLIAENTDMVIMNAAGTHVVNVTSGDTNPKIHWLRRRNL